MRHHHTGASPRCISYLCIVPMSCTWVESRPGPGKERMPLLHSPKQRNIERRLRQERLLRDGYHNSCTHHHPHNLRLVRVLVTLGEGQNSKDQGLPSRWVQGEGLLHVQDHHTETDNLRCLQV